MDPILDTIEHALRRKNLTDAAASKLAVGHPSLIKNLRMPRAGEKRYNLPSLQKLAAVLDLEFYFGPKRAVTGFSETDAVTDFDRKEALRGGFLPIPWHAECRRNGSAPIAFARLWLDENHLAPDGLTAVVPHAIGMSQAVAKDAVALVDSSASRKDSHGLWCMKDKGQITVALVTFNDAAIIIHASDSLTPPRILTPQDLGVGSILGRVVWLGQTIPYKGSIR